MQKKIIPITSVHTPVSPLGITNHQMVSYNSWTASYPSSTPSFSIATPLQLAGQIESPSLGQGIFNNPIYFTNQVDTSTDDERRRNFFFQLKTAIATKITANNHIGSNREGPKDFNRDGYNATATSNCVPFFRLLSMATCCYADSKMNDLGKRKLQEEIPIGIDQFATRFAIGLIYQFQDQIPLLIPASRSYVVNYFCNLVFCYSLGYEKRNDFSNATVYSLLMHSSNCYRHGIGKGYYQLFYKPPEAPNLYTYNGTELTMQHLLSSGVRTMYGGKYEPTNEKNLHLFNELKEKNFPAYRKGTKEVELAKYQSSNRGNFHNINLKCTENETNGDSGGKEELFWQEAEALAQQYLSPQEYAKVT